MFYILNSQLQNSGTATAVHKLYLIIWATCTKHPLSVGLWGSPREQVSPTAALKEISSGKDGYWWCHQSTRNTAKEKPRALQDHETGSLTSLGRSGKTSVSKCHLNGIRVSRMGRKKLTEVAPSGSQEKRWGSRAGRPAMSREHVTVYIWTDYG